MKINLLKYFLLSVVLGNLFVMLIYNIDVILYYLSSLYENHILIYTGEVIFNFFLYLYLYKKTKANYWLIFLMTVITPIVIDASVLITNTDKIPVRFPFSTIFPLIGAGLAIIKLQSSKILFNLSFLATTLILLSIYQIVLPKLFFYSLEKSKSQNEISVAFFEKTFYTTENKPIILKDTLNSKCAIIECFFKGCTPCESKKKTLEKIRKKYDSKDLTIVFICDGSITGYNDFIDYSKLNNNKGFIFLFDSKNILKKDFKIEKYPFEIFSNKTSYLKTFTGFDEQIENEYYKNKITEINKTLNEKNTNN